MARSQDPAHKEMAREGRQAHSSLFSDPSRHSEAFGTNHCQVDAELACGAVPVAILLNLSM